MTEVDAPTKPRRRWYQFGLRTLLGVMTVVALLLVGVPTAMHWWTWPEDRQRTADALSHVERVFDQVNERNQRYMFGPVEYKFILGLSDEAKPPYRFNDRDFVVYPQETAVESREEAIDAYRSTHWRYYMNWAPRLIENWWQADEVDENPFGPYGESPFG